MPIQNSVFSAGIILVLGIPIALGFQWHRLNGQDHQQMVSRSIVSEAGRINELVDMNFNGLPITSKEGPLLAQLIATNFNSFKRDRSDTDGKTIVDVRFDNFPDTTPWLRHGKVVDIMGQPLLIRPNHIHGFTITFPSVSRAICRSVMNDVHKMSVPVGFSDYRFQGIESVYVGSHTAKTGNNDNCEEGHTNQINFRFVKPIPVFAQ